MDEASDEIFDDVQLSNRPALGKKAFRDRQQRRRDIVLALGDEVRTDMIYREDVWERDQGICQICMSIIPTDVGRRGPLSFHIDHIDPRGDHVYENVRATHSFCNGSKGTYDHEPEVAVARARLALALATRTPSAAAPRELDLELQIVTTDRPAFWRRVLPRSWRSSGGRRYADAEEYMASVHDWASRLPEEVARYLAWFEST